MKESVFSFFKAPITNKVPSGVCNVATLHAYITSDKQLEALTQEVRNHADEKELYRKNKLTLLPYVTPAGIFSYCKEQCLRIPSGLFVIDIDHLESAEEAESWRDKLFADRMLAPDLAYVSPGGKGVKLFIPYRMHLSESIENSFDEALHSAWKYLDWQYGLKADTANADLSRGCIVCHDSHAKINL